MARTASPDGHSVAWMVKLTPRESEAADAARAGETRSAWLRSLVVAALDGRAVDKPAPGEEVARQPRQRSRRASEPGSGGVDDIMAAIRNRKGR